MPDVTSHNLVEEVGEADTEINAVLLAEAYLNSTTAALVAVGNAINTANKYAGKSVFNTTTGVLVQAAGSAAGDVWKNVKTGATAHTPA